ncbi:hypothetical protein [Geopsychrobacter electrodiphilus]|uniref:hypothetical protein n=1 Tax=Geopsychrobacter electrodiphilus TaxID=225196 RepID=UPI0003669DC8|nr:hypothetical protein [Geopsychrobacter electrodiphilus]
MPTGKSGRKGFADSISIKGKVTGFAYQNPKKRSTLEIYANNEQALKGVCPLLSVMANSSVGDRAKKLYVELMKQ